MTPVPAVTLAALLALGGCASLAHHADDSFEHTQQLAEAADPDAQLDLARMFADPAAWPQAAGMPAQPGLAAMWCAASARCSRRPRPQHWRGVRPVSRSWLPCRRRPANLRAFLASMIRRLRPYCFAVRATHPPESRSLPPAAYRKSRSSGTSGRSASGIG